PFRTEKLSPTAPMVLHLWESRSPPFFFLIQKSNSEYPSGYSLFFLHTTKGKIELIIIGL
ncbi:MAG: hypothetical protein QNK55_06625, partial [Saprospiraceae bacterium]